MTSLRLLLVAVLAVGCARRESVPPPSAVAKPTPNETRLRVFEATAYSIEGLTASGARTREGIVAADPRVLPLGSRIRVHESNGYDGEYVVQDTGREIKGQEIDVYLANDREAKHFGRRRVKVEVLSRGDGTR